MNFEKITEAIKDEPSFRLKQITKAIFVDLIDNWNDITVLSLSLRERLSEFSLDIDHKLFISEDGNTIKALITLDDGLNIEAVLMKHKDRNTVCVSSQVGCPLGCLFCKTGQFGIKRNLETHEIVSQVLLFSRYLKKRVDNIVFMGMGEPLLNYGNVSNAIKVLNNKDVFNIGMRSISISTAGITPKIEELTHDFPQVNLAISLHAPNDKLRSELMPVNNQYPLDDLMKMIQRHISKTHRKVMFEYLMIKNINDGDIHAKELTSLMKNNLYMVNLIKYNPTGKFEASSNSRIKRFKEILEENHINVTERYSFGQDIEGACGQLACE